MILCFVASLMLDEPDVPPCSPTQLSNASSDGEPFERRETVDGLKLHFAYPKEVSADPTLAVRLQMEFDQEASKHKKSMAGSTESYSFSAQYRLIGQSRRLLSLSHDWVGYGEAAHIAFGTEAFLWDRHSKQPLRFEGVFANSLGVSELLNGRWCAAYRKMIARTPEWAGPKSCPAFGNIAAQPADRDQDGRFETIRLIASPLEGPGIYSGQYETEIAVTPNLIAKLKGEYRGSFEAN